MATLLQDNFDRANSTTTVGAPQVGPTPTATAGTLGISGNQLYPVTFASSEAWLVYDLGTPNVEISFTRASQWQADAILGYTSTTDFYLFAMATSGSSGLWRRVGANFVLLASTGNLQNSVTGDVVRASLKDGVFRCYYNNVRVIKYAAQDAVTGTQSGVRLTQSSACRVDNLLGTDAPALDPPSTGGFRSVDRIAATNTPRASFLYRGRDSKPLDTAGVA